MSEPAGPPPKLRSIVYVDGFNLYYGSLSRSSYRWLNLEELFLSLRPHDEIQRILYFTAKVTGTTANPEQGDRQATYLRALETTSLVQVFLGRFKTKNVRCSVRDCTFEGRRFFKSPEEKRTDVNIALRMLDDAHRDDCDRLVLVSGDSDLVPAIDLVKERFPEKEVTVYVPARNQKRAAAAEIRGAADKARTLPMELIKRSQFPTALSFEGREIRKPEGW